MDWFLYDNGLRHEGVHGNLLDSFNLNLIFLDNAYWVQRIINSRIVSQIKDEDYCRVKRNTYVVARWY